jgi:DnaJ like chaperone protein
MRRDRRQWVFVENVTMLAAKLAKVDGPVSRVEVNAFRANFQIPEDMPERVGEIYNRAKESAAGFESAARRLADNFSSAPALLAAVLDALIRVAVADGPVNQAEAAFLERVSQMFGLGARSFTGNTEPARDDPNGVLGLDKSASMDIVKSTWRKLSRQFHPDVLMAKGLSQEQVAMATRKMAEINAAYDGILAERGES